MRISMLGGMIFSVWLMVAGLAVTQETTLVEEASAGSTHPAVGEDVSTDAVSSAAAEESSDDPTTSEEPLVLKTWPINSGIVILEGQYIAKPYILRQEGESILLNDYPLNLEKMEGVFMGRGGWHPRMEDRRDESDRPWSRRRRNPLARLERQLKSNMMLLGFRDGTIGFITPGREHKILETLMSSSSEAMKIQQLIDTDIYWISSAQWQELVKTFEPDPALERTLTKLKAALPRNIALPEVKSANRATTAYVMTVIALVLGVYGMGMLMNHLPKHGMAWRDVDTTGEQFPMVIRSVVLVVAQGSFDLGCTLVARQSPSFWELNPMGSVLIEDPVALTGFKFASLLAGASILLWLRRYRGAQTAAWWLCLLSTIVVFRWVTFGSMFMT